MKIRVQSIHFDADVKLLEFVQHKLNKLDSFYSQIVSGEVFLRLENADNTANKVVEVKLHIPGKDFFVKEQRHTFEEAIDIAVETMASQLRRHKEKVKSHHSHSELIEE